MPRKPAADAPAAPGCGAALGVIVVAVTAALSLLPSEPADLRSDASTDALENYLRRAESNVALPCLTRYSRKIKDTPKSVALAAAPTCWQEYWDFLHQNELPFFEDQALLATLGGEESLTQLATSAGAEVPARSIVEALATGGAFLQSAFDAVDHHTAYLTTALLIVDSVGHSASGDGLPPRLRRFDGESGLGTASRRRERRSGCDERSAGGIDRR
jgi:hypothetical protein